MSSPEEATEVADAEETGMDADDATAGTDGGASMPGTMPGGGSGEDGVGVTVGIEQLQTFLAGDDANIREYAATQLAALAADAPEDVQRASSALLARLEDDHPPVRARAADAVSTLAAATPTGFTDDVDALADALDDGRNDVSASVASALAAVADHDPGAVSPVADALTDRLGEADCDAAVRALAAVAEHDPGAVAPATDELADAFSFAPADAARALAATAEGEPSTVATVADALADAVETEVSAVRTDAAAALADVAETDADAVTPRATVLVDALDDAERAVGGHATHALASVAEYDPAAVADGASALAVQLDSSDAAVRADAAAALAAVGDDDPPALVDVVTSLAGHLADRQPAVRRGVARALAAVASHDPESVVSVVAELADALGDTDEPVRIGVADAIASVAAHDPDAVAPSVDAAVAGLDDVDAVREPLATAVADVATADPDAVAPHVDALAAHLTDDADAVREPLATAVAAVARDGAEDADVDALTDSLKGEDAWVRGYAARALVEAADHATTSTLPPALARLVDRLADDADAVRAAAATDVAAVAEASPRELAPAIPALVDALDDPEVTVREGVAGAVAAVADADARAVRNADAVPALVDRLDDADAVRDPIEGALATIAPEGDADVRPLVGLLLDRLDHDAPEERRRAARALTRVELAPTAHEPVTAALLDAMSDDDTRTTVTRTLATLATADDGPRDALVDRVADDDAVAALALAGVAAFDSLAADVPVLTDAAVSTDVVVRRGATRALAAIASQREDTTTATGVLLDYTDAADATTRERAARELGRHALARPDDARTVANDVTDLLDAADDRVRGYGTVALASVVADDSRGVAASDDALAHRDGDDHEWFEDAVAFVRGHAGGDADPTGAAKALAGRLDDQRPYVRAVGALAAGTLDGTRPKRLADCLRDDALVVRAAGARGLAAIADRDPDAVAAVAGHLVDVLGDDPAVVEPAVRALAAVARVDPDAVPDTDAVAAQLTHPDPRVQAAAARAIGHVAPDAHTSTLRVLRVDGTDRARQAAVDALDGLGTDATDDREADDDSWLARLSPKRVFGGSQG